MMTLQQFIADNVGKTRTEQAAAYIAWKRAELAALEPPFPSDHPIHQAWTQAMTSLGANA